MNRQDLFDHTAAALRGLADGPTFDDWAAVSAAGHVRKLLMDDDPLLHQVNRQRRKRLIFEVAHNAELDALQREHGVLFRSEGVGLSPRLALKRYQVVPLKLDPFLAWSVVISNGNDVSVKQVVYQMANVEGGVHAGKPKTDLEKKLHAVNAELSAGGAGGVAASMRGIAAVVVDALDPLVIWRPAEMPDIGVHEE